MKNFLTLLLIVSIAFSAVPAEAASKAKTPTLSNVEAATVNLYCRIKLGGRTLNSTGSGVFISDRGVILTNAHVGQYFLMNSGSGKSTSNCVIRTGSPAKDQYTASVLYISPQWLNDFAISVDEKQASSGSGRADFALLYVTGSKKGKLPEKFPAVPIADAQSIMTLPVGEEVSISGYPAEKLSYKSILEKLVLLTASSSITETRSFDRPFTDILVLAPSKAGQQGVSGGPVARTSGEVVGIVTTTGDSTSKGMRSIRAVSIVHMNRIAVADTGLVFPLLYAGDLATRAKLTESAFTFDVRAMLEKRIRQIR